MSFKNFTHEQFEKVFSDIMEQKISRINIKETLLWINDFGFSTQVFLGAVTALKKRMIKIKAPKNAIDVCGTGGDKLQTLNIATAVCFVVAYFSLLVGLYINSR